MPLILIAGLPSSGKSKTAECVLDFFKARLARENSTQQVRIVSDSDNLDWDGRDNIFTSISKEKELRGWLRAEAHRFVNLNHIVILDSAAYIKGYRYELHCMTKEAKTQYCVIERFLNPDVCWTWNEERRKRLMNENGDFDADNPDTSYSRATFDALVQRYENCDPADRWDSPLFKITDEIEPIDLEGIYNVIVEGDPLRPNVCTYTATSSSTIYKQSN